MEKPHDTINIIWTLQLSCAKYDVIFDQQNTFLNMYEKINVI